MYEKFKRSDWFRQDRFGLFIHWGLYATPARGEWVRSTEQNRLQPRHTSSFSTHSNLWTMTRKSGPEPPKTPA